MEPSRLDLPGGAWADIRDPKKITRNGRKPVRQTLMALSRYRTELLEWALAVKSQETATTSGIIGMQPIDPEAEKKFEGYSPDDHEMDLLEATQEALTVALVSSWSFDLPITTDSLNEIPSDAADLLIEHCDQFIDQISFSAQPSPDESSPTTP